MNKSYIRNDIENLIQYSNKCENNRTFAIIIFYNYEIELTKTKDSKFKFHNKIYDTIQELFYMFDILNWRETNTTHYNNCIKN